MSGLGFQDLAELGITQSYASAILRKLIELDYVERKGNDFWLANDGMGAVVNIFEDE